MIKIDKLDKYFFKGKSNENHVLQEISLEIDTKGLVCILGESGSGKTTLLNTIGGLDTFGSGSIAIDDTVVTKYDPRKIEALRNRKFGYIFQNYYLLQDYTVAYNVKLALNIFDLTEEEKDERTEYVLRALGMERYKKKKVSQLSGGQQQRVSIARALVKSPEIILADEPTGNLDEENTLNIMGILKNISKECLVILVTHEKSVAKFFADRIIEVADGRIIKDYSNKAAESYQRMDDSNIYLRDMEKEELQSEQTDLSLFWDREEEPAGKIRLQLAWKDGKLYIQSQDELPLVLAGEAAGCVMLDESRPKLEKAQVEEASAFDLPACQAGKSAALPPGQIWKLALENIKMMGKKHKFVVGIMLAMSVLLVLALADYMMQHVIDQKAIVTSDSHYVTVQLEPSSSQESKVMNGQVSDFLDKHVFAGEIQDVCVKTAGVLNIQYKGFRQLEQVNGRIDNFDIVSLSKLGKNDILAGRMPEKRTEIVIDRWLIDVFRDSGSVLGAVYHNENAILNTELGTLIPDLKLKVVGICDRQEPSIYVTDGLMLGMCYEGYYVMSDVELRKFYPEEFGDVELKDHELMMTKKSFREYTSMVRWMGNEGKRDWAREIGQNYPPLSDYTSIDVKGVHPEGTGAAYVFSQKICDELKKEYIRSSRGFRIYTDDADGTIARLEQAGKQYKKYFRVTAVNDARQQLENFEKEQKGNINAGYLVTLAVAILAFVVIYFTVKSNAMARNEELTVYRLIGISAGSIIKAYMLEMLLVTMYTCIPGVLITTGIIKFITSIPSLEIHLLFPWWMAVVLILALILVHCVISILPVHSILSKPPAQLAAKS